MMPRRSPLKALTGFYEDVSTLLTAIVGVAAIALLVSRTRKPGNYAANIYHSGEAYDDAAGPAAVVDGARASFADALAAAIKPPIGAAAPGDR